MTMLTASQRIVVTHTMLVEDYPLCWPIRNENLWMQL